jgi:hypothetical protein
MNTIEKIDKYLKEKGEKDGAEYKALFKKILKKYGKDEPDQLSDEDKKKFFNEIDKAWKADKETD